ncbi:hypothetical protein PCE1_003844 [Barthelona sp. PCE]
MHRKTLASSSSFSGSTQDFSKFLERTDPDRGKEIQSSPSQEITTFLKDVDLVSSNFLTEHRSRITNNKKKLLDLMQDSGQGLQISINDSTIFFDDDSGPKGRRLVEKNIQQVDAAINGISDAIQEATDQKKRLTTKRLKMNELMYRVSQARNISSNFTNAHKERSVSSASVRSSPSSRQTERKSQRFYRKSTGTPRRRRKSFKKGANVGNRKKNKNPFEFSVQTTLSTENLLSASEMVVRNQIFHSFKSGSIHRIKRLLSAVTFSLLSLKDSNGNNLFHLAVESREPEVINILLKRLKTPGYENELFLLNEVNDIGQLPLHRAVILEAVTVVQLILPYTQFADVVDISMQSPLHYAVLVPYHDDELDNYPIIEALMDVSSVEVPNEDGRTPLHVAVSMNLKPICELLMRKADIAAVDVDGNTSLHIAAQMSGPDIVEMLIENGCDVNARNSYAMTPLHFASRSGLVKNVELLLEGGANPNVIDYHGWTPLHEVAGNVGVRNVSMPGVKNHEDTINTLVSYGAYATAKDSYGCAPSDVTIVSHIKNLLLSHAAAEMAMNDFQGYMKRNKNASIGNSSMDNSSAPLMLHNSDVEALMSFSRISFTDMEEAETRICSPIDFI